MDGAQAAGARLGVTLRETRIEVERVGSPVIEAGPEGAAEAVLFVHGNPGSRLDWSDLVRRTGSLARAVAFDMPGFGEADKPNDFTYTVHGYARFIQGALARLGVQRVHLVAHDFGGPFGLAWAAANPSALSSVVLINTPPLAGYRWHAVARGWRTPVLGGLIHLVMNRRLFELTLRRGQRRPLPPEAIDRMWRHYDGGTQFAVLKLYRATHIPKTSPVESLLRSQRRPALVVWGRRDPYIPVRFAEAHLAAFPDAEFVYLDDSGHWPFLDDPEGSAAAIVPFLQRQVGRLRT